MNNFSIIFFVFLFFISFSSFSQEISSISENLEISIIDNQENVNQANKTIEKKSSFSNKTSVNTKKVSSFKKENNTVLIKAIQELNNKLDSVISENQMLRTHSPTHILNVDSK